MKNSNMPQSEIVIDNYKKDRFKHKICVAKCPYCYNFFTVRADSLKNGNTKSCGCLKHRSKPNAYYFPLGCDFVVGYYDNTDGSFIFDKEEHPTIKEFHWSDKNTKGRHEPIAKINGKTTSLARFLLNPPTNLEGEHINRIPSDNRICNLRTATRIENNQNRKNAKKDNAKYGEYSLSKSQEIAKEIETYYFHDSFYYTGVLDEISNLPEKNIFKITLKNISRMKLDGTLSEENENGLLLKLMTDYLREKKERLETLQAITRPAST